MLFMSSFNRTELFKHRGAAATDGQDKARSSQRTPGSPGGGDKTGSGLQIPPRMVTTTRGDSKAGRAAERAGEEGLGGGGGEFAHVSVERSDERGDQKTFCRIFAQ